MVTTQEVTEKSVLPLIVPPSREIPREPSPMTIGDHWKVLFITCTRFQHDRTFLISKGPFPLG